MDEMDNEKEKQSNLLDVTFSQPADDASDDQESKAVHQSRWKSIRIMYLTCFLDSVSFTICFSSLWPYMQQVDSEADPVLLGWVLASYSLGQFVAGPAFGALSIRMRQTKMPLIISLVISTVAAFLYAYTEFFPPRRSFVLLVSRTLMGIRAGNMAPVRSYISAATTMKERTGVMAILTGAQCMGYIVGPAIQAAFVPLGYPGPIHVPGFHLNMFTAAGFFGAILSISNIVLLVTSFSEHRVSDTGSREEIDIADDEKMGKSSSLDCNFDSKVSVITCLFLLFSVQFCFTVYEVIMNPLSMHMFMWDGKQATFYNGIILVVLGMVGIGVFLVIKYTSHRFDDRVGMLLGFIFFFLGFSLLWPFGDVFPTLQRAHSESFTNNTLHYTNGDNSSSSYNISYLASTTVVPPLMASTPAPGGCPVEYDWCTTVPKVHLEQYLVANAMLGLGYPLTFALVYTIFSKILGSSPQGIMMGVITSVGCIARFVGPIYVTQIYERYGPRVAFVTTSAICLLSIITCAVTFKKLKPATKSVPEEPEEQELKS